MSVPEYTAGGWTAVACRGFLALLGPEAGEGTARSLRERGPEGLVAALGVVAHGGFAGLPPFALASVGDGRVHLALRGPVSAVVTTAAGERELRSGDVGTWSEQVLEDVVGLALRADEGAGDAGADAGSAALPLADGVVRAGSLGVRLGAVAPERPAPAAAVAVAPPGAGEGSADEPGVDESTADEPGVDEPTADGPALGGPEPDDSREVALVALDAAPDDDVDDLDQSGEAETLPAVPVLPTPASPAVANGYGLVPDAPAAPPFAAPAPAHAPAAPAGHVPPAPMPRVPAAPPAPPVLPAPPAPEAQAPATQPVPVGASSHDDHDGLTILSGELAAIREQLPAWAADWSGQDPVPGPFAVPTGARRHPHLVLSTGLDVELDRTVLLGRAPQVARVTNRELPRLVTVPSPEQDISRTHAEVRTEGDDVLVTDLHSTNGVHVTRQGEGARRLHPGEPTVVVPGEVVDLGDGVTFTVERGT